MVEALFLTFHVWMMVLFYNQYRCIVGSVVKIYYITRGKYCQHSKAKAEDLAMKKLKMTVGKLTFEEGCNKYLEYCRQRNLREGTIRHYRQSYLHFYMVIGIFDDIFYQLLSKALVFIELKWVAVKRF